MENSPSISIHPSIGYNESLANLDMSRMVDVDGLKSVDPIAVIKMFQNHPTPILDSQGNQMHTLMKLFQGIPGGFQETPIDSALLYHPDDVREILGCTPEEYQIISVGRSSKCDLRPNIVLPDGTKDLDECVSRYHCAISYNSETGKIQISDIGTEKKGSTNGTHLEGDTIFLTTKPWIEGAEAGIGNLVPGSHIYRVGLKYFLTEYGRQKGVNEVCVKKGSPLDISSLVAL